MNEKKTDVDICNNYSLGLRCNDMNVDKYITKTSDFGVIYLFSF